MARALSITDHESHFPDGELLVSRTDPKGRIVFANQEFIKISGYSESELIGKPHSLVRHPHMPKAAFADLWSRIKAGGSWEGLVKNRTKDGGFYWVRANVAPMMENGEITGFVSIRTKPSRADIAEAERVYAQMRDGTLKGWGLRGGRIVRSGWRGRIEQFCASLGGRLIISFSMMFAMLLVTAWVGLAGMLNADYHLKSVFEDRTVPLYQLSDMTDHMRDNLHLLQMAEIRLDENVDPAELTPLFDEIRANARNIDGTWDAYMATYLTPEESRLAAQFISERDRFVDEGLKPAIELARAGDLDGLRKHFVAKAAPLFSAAVATNLKLRDLQLRVAQEEYADAASDRNAREIIAACIVAVCAIGIVVLWRMNKATIQRPLDQLEAAFAALAAGNFAADIRIARVPEFFRATNFLRTMKVKLAYGIQERAEMQAAADLKRREDLDRIANSLNERLRGVIDGIGNSSGTLLNEAEGLAGNAEHTRRQGESTSETAIEVAGNVESVSAATQELSASIGEIARNVADTARICQEAVQQASSTDEMVRSLSEAAGRIGDVVNLINSIAEQTNLLALNATIEAARAGDAGKGFAVVAGEVKNLANQTAQATGDINSQIADIQAKTSGAVGAIQAIRETIQKIAELSTTLAAAVEEQGAATDEIARNAMQAAQGTDVASQNMSSLNAAACETGDRAKHIQSAAVALKGEAERLDQTVRTAVSEIRAA
ncbi:MAG: Tar ligand binding domain-containing protein [Rhodospirillales bacterium]|nr:Tar ligand binding domain-containing protein [Rhodospirillales bacterium]